MKPPISLVFMTLASLTGCGIFSNVFTAEEANRNGSPAPSPTPCISSLAGTQVALVYPANGSTGIPENVGEVIFAVSTSPLSSSYHAYLIDQTDALQGPFAALNAWSQTLPQPAATPPFSNAFYQASANTGETFPKGHVLSVELQLNSCAPTASYGSFTVQ